MNLTASVVICSHNRPSFLCETLEVLGRQTVAPEIIIIDDSVETPHWAREYTSKMFHFKWDGRYHRTSKFNLGINKSTKDNIILLDDDCIPRDQYFVEAYLVGLRTQRVVRGCFWHEGAAKFTPWFSTANIGFEAHLLRFELNGFDMIYDGEYGYEDLDMEQRLAQMRTAWGEGNSYTAVEHRGSPYNGSRTQVNEAFYRKKWGFAPIA